MFAVCIVYVHSQEHMMKKVRKNERETSIR